MCGFVVAMSTQQEGDVSSSGLRRMSQSIRHRGPDASGESFHPGVCLAHQRLSIIDPKSRPQPLRNGRFSLVYNGEIYNHIELRKELEALGHYFESDCDTDVFLAAYSVWGKKAFVRLNGMFSAVIFDHETGDIIAVRDRFGIKPLYVGELFNEGVLLFASEQQAIESYSLNHDWSIDHESIDQYLTLGYFIEPNTSKKGIRQVLPGTYEVSRVGNDHTVKHTYWSVAEQLNKPQIRISTEDGADLVKMSVQRQMVADAPVGAFLSGGLDSGMIVSLMQSMSSSPVQCYSAGFTNKIYDESHLARALAQDLGAEHHIKNFGDELLRGVPDVIETYGGPFADNAALPTYYLSQMAAEKVKVMLSGDGADELFFGYRNHRSLFMETALKGLVPNWFNKTVMAWLASVYPNHPSMPRFMRAKSTFKALSMGLAEGYCSAMSVTNREVLNSLYSPEFKARLSGQTTEARFAEIAQDFEHDDPMKVMQYLDFKTYLPGSVLTKVDRATMRAGIEARVPFLDNDLSNVALTQPSKRNLGFGQHKTQLREWGASCLPEASVNRAKKSFTSPLDSWFRGLQYHTFCRMIASESLLDSRIFDVDKLYKLMDEHYRGKANHGTTLWSLSVLSKAI